jgi:hypothetical protein
MRRVEVTAMALTAIALAGCGGSSGGTNTTSGRQGSSPSSTTATSTQPATATTPIETSTSGHRPPCPDCGAGLHPASAARAALTTTDPKVGCELLATPRYVATAYGGGSGCVAALKAGAAAESVRVVTTHRIANGALVIAIPKGGPNAGERLRVSIVREPAKVPGGQTPPLWRVDAVRSNAKVGP